MQRDLHLLLRRAGVHAR